MRRAIVTAAFGVASILAGAGRAHAQALDLDTQDVLLDVSDPATTRVELHLSFTAIASASSFSALRFALPITRAEVDGIAVVPVPHPQYPEYLTQIPLPAPVSAGETVDVSITLAGTPTCGGGQKLCMRTADRTVFTPASPGTAVYYLNPFATDPFEGRVDVVLPAGHLARAANGGAPTITTTAPGLETWSFPFASPTELFGIWVGDGAKFDAVSKEAVVDVVGTFEKGVDHPEEVSRAVELSAQLLPVLSEQYGALPITRADLVSVPKSFAFGAMSTLGVVYVNDVVFTTHTYLVDQGMAHELSHFWWGNLANASDVDEAALLGEGMAEYAGFRALGALRGTEARTAGMRMNAAWYMYRRPDDEDDTVIGVDRSSPVFIHLTYHKGAMTFRALEEDVGADAFDRALKRFFARGQGGLSLDALAEDVAAESGVDVAAQITQWTRQRGYPRLRATSRAVSGGVEIELTLDGDYHLTVPVRVVSTQGEVVEQKLVIDPGTSRHVVAASSATASVEIDPTWSMVREVSPVVEGDVDLDGRVDGTDLIAVALRQGAYLPEERRVDGAYDALHDVARDEVVDGGDLERVLALARADGL